MKKILFLSAALTAMVMTSCSNDEIIENGSSRENPVISFTSAPQNAMTRSVVTSLNSFCVNAITSDRNTYVTNEEFTLSGGKFTSSSPYYWPTSKTLSFFAINESGNATFPALASGDFSHGPVIRYDVDTDGDRDIVVATCLNASKQETVPLTFKHVLSRVGVKFTSVDSDNSLTYVVKSVKVPAYLKAYYSFYEGKSTGEWEYLSDYRGTEIDYCKGQSQTFTGGSSWSCSDMYNIIPMQGWHPIVTVEYQVLQNGQVVVDKTGENAAKVALNVPSEGWAQGSCFNFVFYLSNSASDTPIQFTSTVTPWSQSGDDEYNL